MHTEISHKTMKKTTDKIKHTKQCHKIMRNPRKMLLYGQNRGITGIYLSQIHQSIKVKCFTSNVKKIWVIGTILYMAILYLVNSKFTEDKKVKIMTYIGIIYFVDIIALGIHYKKSLLEQKRIQNNGLTNDQLVKYNNLKCTLRLLMHGANPKLRTIS